MENQKKIIEDISVRAISLGRGMKRREGRDGEDSDDLHLRCQGKSEKGVSSFFPHALALNAEREDSDDLFSDVNKTILVFTAHMCEFSLREP